MKGKEPKGVGYNPNAVSDREMEMERRNRHRDMEFWNLMAQVVDSTPIEKQRKRDIADVLQEIFMLAREDPRPAGQAKGTRPGMVEENIVRSLPNMSKQQLDFMKKEYTKKANKIKEDKVDKGKSLTNQEKIILKTYQAIGMELNKRMQQENINKQNRVNEARKVMEPEKDDKKKKKASSKR
jgi:hypothetical protein